MGMKDQPFDPRDHEAFVREIDPMVYESAVANLPRGVIPRRRGMTWLESLASDVAASGSRRPTFPVNLINPAGPTSLLQTLGTVTVSGAHPDARTFSCVATSSGSTARITGGPSTLTLDTGKTYELSVNVVAYQVANQGAMIARWLEASSGVSSGTQALTMSSTVPMPGNRYGIRFVPSNASNIFRFGFGCNAGENVTAGDTIVFSDAQLCEVDSLSGSVTSFSYAPYGAAGMAASSSDTLGSCILVCGDSWMNDATDPGQLLATTFGRELVLSATAGHRLDQIASALEAKFASGKTGLNRPYFHTPKIAVVQGGINDVAADANAATVFSRLMSIVGQLTIRKMPFLVVLPVLATDAASYTAARGAVISEYHKRCYKAGFNILRPGDWCLTAAGARDTTYMDVDGIHLTTAGCAKLAGQIDDAIRAMESTYHFLRSSITY